MVRKRLKKEILGYAVLLATVLALPAGGSAATEPAPALTDPCETPEARGVCYDVNWNELEPVTVPHIAPWSQDELGNTPLHLAARYNTDPKVIAGFVRMGVKVNQRNNKQETPLHVAAANTRNPEIIEALLEKGALITARDHDGFTPIHYAAALNVNAQVLRQLLAPKYGGNYNVVEKYNTTPLHMAAQFNKNHAIVALLLDLGAEINLENSSGDLPIHLAAAHNPNPSVTEILMYANSNLAHKNKDGDTPYDLAQQNLALKQHYALIYELLNRQGKK